MLADALRLSALRLRDCEAQSAALTRASGGQALRIDALTGLL